MALIGQVQSMASILQGVSSGLFSTAAVKHTAEWKEEPERLNRFLSLSYTLAFWITLAVGGMTGAFSWWLAESLLNDRHYWWVFAILGMTIPLFVTNSLVLAVINGLGDVKKLTVLNIGQSILGLLLSLGMPLLFGLKGALAAAIFSTSVVFVLLWPELRSHTWLKIRAIDVPRDMPNIDRLKGFVLMAIVSAVCTPLSQLIVREWIVEKCSVQEAGYWQGLMRFSGAYLMFFTTTLSVYYLPRFATLDARAISKELLRGYKILLPSIVVLFATIWLARSWLVSQLFSLEFTPIESLLGYQLFGDFLKIGSWMISFLMLARGRTALFVASEVAFSALYVILSIMLVGVQGEGGVRGALFAWIALYAAYWIFLIMALPSLLRGDEKIGTEKNITAA